MADTSTDRLVGRIVKPHGVHGELVIELRTDSPEVRFAVGSALSATLRDGTTRTMTVTAARPHSGRLLVTFDGVRGRDSAEELRGTLLLAAEGDLPPTDDPDEFYDHQLEGLAVFTTDGTKIGEVREILHGGGSDLLAVRREGRDEVLVPFVSEIVPEVDLRAGRVVIDPPQGLLDEE
ncbi:MAG TPA: ribosome maturation factor RimM [Pseudonocardiaceae bacterium]|jgi:16S rRNA processing protein RimM|nr:ribosome maturation factor RimM [Pseudonocardiaceae bacterium]